MFYFPDAHGFQARAFKNHNKITFKDEGMVVNKNLVEVPNPGLLTCLLAEALNSDLGPEKALVAILNLNHKKVGDSTVFEKIKEFEKTATPALQGVVFEQLLTRVKPVEVTPEIIASKFVGVLEAFGLKKTVVSNFPQEEVTLKKVKEQSPPTETAPEENFKMKTVELVPTITVNKNPASIVSDATVKVAEEATVDVALKAVLDEMSDDTYQALKGLLIDEILEEKKLEPSKAAGAREILMGNVTLDILKSENPKEAILAILYEKVVSKENFDMMVAKAEKESEKVPTTLVEALDVIDDSKPNFGRQYPKRRKGKR